MQGKVALLTHNTLILFDKHKAVGGAEGDRTPDLLIANEALSHLSYSPALPFGYIAGAFSLSSGFVRPLILCAGRPLL